MTAFRNVTITGTEEDVDRVLRVLQVVRDECSLAVEWEGDGRVDDGEVVRYSEAQPTHVDRGNVRQMAPWDDPQLTNNQRFWTRAVLDQEPEASYVKIFAGHGFPLKRYPKEGDYPAPALIGMKFQSGVGYVEHVVDSTGGSPSLADRVLRLAVAAGLGLKDLDEERWDALLRTVLDQ